MLLLPYISGEHIVTSQLNLNHTLIEYNCPQMLFTHTHTYLSFHFITHMSKPMMHCIVNSIETHSHTHTHVMYQLIRNGILNRLSFLCWFSFSCVLFGFILAPVFFALICMCNYRFATFQTEMHRTLCVMFLKRFHHVEQNLRKKKRKCDELTYIHG